MKQIACPSCSAKFDVSTFPAGKRFRCGKCKEVLTVPEDAFADDPMPELDQDPEPEPEQQTQETMTDPQAADGYEGAAAGPEAQEAEAEPVAAARPAARRPAARGAKPARGHGARPAPVEEVEDAGVDVAAKVSSPLPKILAAVLALAVLGGGGFFAWKKFGKGGAGGGDGVMSADGEYAKRLKKLTKDDARQQLQIALWCKSAGIDKYESHLREAAKLSPNDTQVKSALAEFYWTNSKPPASAADCLAAAAEAKAAGMEGEKKRMARLATTLEPENEAAWDLLGCARYEPEGGKAKWLPKTEADKARQSDAATKLAKEKVAAMSPREKKIVELKQGLIFEFGPEIQFADDKPFLFCMQKDPSFNAELVLDGYISELKAFYKRFYDRYGEKFKLGDLSEEVMLIWVFKSPQAYFKYGENIGIPKNAGGHWEPNNERLMIFNVPTEMIERADPYGTIFHETTHMIVTFATKLRGKPSGQMFWFTEGIATYFEPFERDKATGKIQQQVGTLNKGRLGGIKQWASTGRFVHLKDLFSWSYGEFAGKNQDHIQKNDLAWGAYCYAEAWSLLYFFYNYDNGKYAAKFEQYFTEELNGNPGFATFKKIFGDDIDSLEKEWLDYTKSLK